jgi:endonuclease-3 related protein
MEIYRLMFDRFGAQHWWPGDSRFEIILGAILTQNTNWTNVEKAIVNVKNADALCPEKLYRMDTEMLAQLIKPAGYFNLKAGRLKNFLQWLFDNYDGQVDALENLSVWDIREQLLGIKGIGPETADSIALYAYDKPVFVVDTYTCRIMVRHGLIEPEAGYEQVREFMEASLPGEIELFNEYHALLVQVGKKYCRPKPKCGSCPLECLPHSCPS